MRRTLRAVSVVALAGLASVLIGAPAAHAQPALTFDTPFDGIGATPGFGFAGTGVAGDTVAVTDDGPEGNDIAVCTGTVDADGNWTCTPSSTAQEGIGTHHYTATETDASGTSTVTITVQVTNTPMTVTDEEPFQGPTAGGTQVTLTGTNFQPGSTVSIDGGPPITPDSISADGTMLVFTTPAHAAEAATVRVMTPSNGAFFPFEFDFIPPDPPTFTAPAAGARITNRTPAISGTGSPGDTVTVTDNGATVCTATVAAGGTWSCTPSSPLPVGRDTLRATQSDGTGTSDPATDTVRIAAAASPSPSPSASPTRSASPSRSAAPSASPVRHPTSAPSGTRASSPAPTRVRTSSAVAPVPPPVSTPPAGPPLADTGFSTNRTVGFGLLLLIAGGALLLLTPRALVRPRGRHAAAASARPRWRRRSS